MVLFTISKPEPCTPVSILDCSRATSWVLVEPSTGIEKERWRSGQIWWYQVSGLYAVSLEMASLNTILFKTFVTLHLLRGKIKLSSTYKVWDALAPVFLSFITFPHIPIYNLACRFNLISSYLQSLCCAMLSPFCVWVNLFPLPQGLCCTRIALICLSRITAKVGFILLP